MLYYLTALDNLGNTCYMNTTLQALYAIREFRNYITQSKTHSPLHRTLSKLFKEMMTCKEKSVSPSEFRDEIIKIMPQFEGKGQQDAQEFLRYIIDRIHEEVNEAKINKTKVKPEPKSAKESWNLYLKFMDNSFLVKLFVGQLSSTIKCTHCQNESYCWDTFWDISLSLPEGDKDSDIKDCLKGYTAQEILDNDSMPTCSKCKVKRKSIKTLQIVRSPLILIIQLKKFGNDGQKISKSVKANYRIWINCVPYQLFACICHNGDDSYTGHYTVFCRYESSQKWYFFDDNEMETIESMSYDLLNGAYILFYRMNGVSIMH